MGGAESSQPTPRREVAAGALLLLDPVPVSELAERLPESLDDLIVGVVEAVQECVLAPRPDCPNLCARAEAEAASWVDDFIADDAPDDDAVVSQHALFQLACLLADADHCAAVASRRSRACGSARRTGPRARTGTSPPGERSPARPERP